VDPASAVALLRRTPFLRSLPEKELAALYEACHLVDLLPGEAVCHEGEEGHAMYVVLAGQLVVSKSGKQVAVSKPGDCLGEMALIESRERAATLRALDEATVLEIPEVAFRRHVGRSPEALMALLRVFSERARNDLEALAADNLKLQSYAAEVERQNVELVEVRRELLEKNRLLERLSALDTLTQVANRRRFDTVLRQEWRRAQRDGSPLSLVFCDIDDFKEYNDAHGHPSGDDCLARVAEAMADCLNRPADLVARYGGDEFVALLVDTDAAGARLVAERMRQAVELLGIERRDAGSGRHVTVSLGIATGTPGRTQRPEDVLRLADRALFAAKDGGRNRIVALGEEEEEERARG
jgi:diguanylate cyclase (GGDEF)-like protein